MVKIIFIGCLSMFTIFGFCEPGQTVENPAVKNISDVTGKKWENLSSKKIFFGHQSVGYNIFDGISSLIEEYPQIHLNIRETKSAESFNEKGIFAHARIGKNENPDSKTSDFVDIMESGVGEKLNIAFHKYCFVDINSSTDVSMVFKSYKEHMTQLHDTYPHVRFVHFTVPLTTIQTGPKAWIKKIIGKPLGGIEENVKRGDFNSLIIKEYEGAEPVFDLAREEATKPDGTSVSFTRKGKEYFALYEGYSSDGGHLNKEGQKVIAEKLLVFLAELP